jgi:K+-transporting ATPase c subunit
MQRLTPITANMPQVLGGPGHSWCRGPRTGIGHSDAGQAKIAMRGEPNAGPGQTSRINVRKEARPSDEREHTGEKFAGDVPIDIQNLFGSGYNVSARLNVARQGVSRVAQARKSPELV